MESGRTDMIHIIGQVSIILYDIFYISLFIKSKSRKKKNYIHLILIIILSIIIFCSHYISVSYEFPN